MRKDQWLVLALGVVASAFFLSCSGSDDELGETRSYDGTGNNLTHSDWGATNSMLLRKAPVGYADGVSTPAGSTRLSARDVSNKCVTQTGFRLNSAGASDFIWQWGQFLDHDLDLTPEADPKDPFLISVPNGDPIFDPKHSGTHSIALNRSVFSPSTGTERGNPRQQINVITAFIDASNVYGSDEIRALALRSLDGTGRMKTSTGGTLLPQNTDGIPNGGGPDPRLFVAGDVRANEQIALISMHSLFVLEHNRLADEIAAENPGATDEEIYQRARKIVGALAEVITYQEFLPLLLGAEAIPPYTGYKPDVNPGIATEFSTAAYRFGHSMLSPSLLLVKPDGEHKLISLKDVFFTPQLVQESGGIEPILLGLAEQQAQEMDSELVDGVRNFLFGEPAMAMFDLAALNMQRGRDHGLPSYNSVRQAYGLSRVTDFSQVTSNPTVQNGLRRAYGTVEDMDLWMAGISEDHAPGAMLGPTFRAILTEQFTRVRDGDRFWYKNDPYFTSSLRAEIENTRLSDIIRRNTALGSAIQDDVFHVR